MGLLDYAKEIYVSGAPARQAVRGLLTGDVSGFKDAGNQIASLFNPEYMKKVKPMSQQDAISMAMDINPVMALSTKAVKSIPKTKYELAHEVAQKNATEMLGLPPNNTAMDRAKALGFDIETPYFHGTNADFNAFDVSGKGKTSGAGAFLTNNPLVAETYTEGVGQGGNIIPLLARKDNLLEVNARGRNWNDINTNDLSHKRTKLTNMFDDLSPNDGTTTDEIAGLAPYGGFNGALIKNVKDNGPNSHVFRAKEYLEKKYGIPNVDTKEYWDGISGKQFAESRDAMNKLYSSQKSDILALQKPEFIRSRFAAFDPARANEADLLGYATPEMLGLLALGSGAGVGYMANKKDKK